MKVCVAAIVTGRPPRRSTPANPARTSSAEVFTRRAACPGRGGRRRCRCGAYTAPRCGRGRGDVQRTGAEVVQGASPVEGLRYAGGLDEVALAAQVRDGARELLGQ